MTQGSGDVLERVAEDRCGEAGATSLLGNVLHLFPATTRSTAGCHPDILGPFNTRIAFGHSVRVGGWTRLSIQQDGSWCFSGHLYDPGRTSYDVAVAWAVCNRGTGDVFEISHSGKVVGSTEPGSGEDHWCDTGVDPRIVAGWAGFFDGGYAWAMRAGANLEAGAIVSAARAAVGAAAGAIPPR